MFCSFHMHIIISEQFSMTHNACGDVMQEQRIQRVCKSALRPPCPQRAPPNGGPHPHVLQQRQGEQRKSRVRGCGAADAVAAFEW